MRSCFAMTYLRGEEVPYNKVTQRKYEPSNNMGKEHLKKRVRRRKSKAMSKPASGF